MRQEANEGLRIASMPSFACKSGMRPAPRLIGPTFALHPYGDPEDEEWEDEDDDDDDEDDDEEPDDEEPEWYVAEHVVS